MTTNMISNTLSNETASKNQAAGLPLRGQVTLAYALSTLVALIVCVVSIVGILYPNAIYPSEEFLQTFVPTEVVKLFIGLPILLISMWLTRRGKLMGVLFWPGALFYMLYSYLICIFIIPLGWIFLLHLTLVMLSLYTLIGLIASIDGTAVRQRLAENVPEKLAGGILVGLGFPFFLLATSIMISSIRTQMPLAVTELALQKVDFLITPTWVIGGWLLWRRKALGYVVGTGLLFQASMLMISLLVLILLKPILTTAAFSLADFVWTFGFSLICLIPFALFVRGISSAQHNKSAKLN